MAKNEKKEDGLENVQEALTTSGSWIIKHQNAITWVITGILAVVLVIMAVHNYYVKPKSAEANNEIGKAVVYFAVQDYEKALNGDDADCIGFESIANDYSLTKGGELAALYAGICYYNLEDYENAVKYLKKFSAKDINVAPAAKLKLGDAYVALGELKEAAKSFKAAAKSENKVLAPLALKKEGLVYLELGDTEAARKAFESIKKDYPNSQEAQDIDKYIENIAE